MSKQILSWEKSFKQVTLQVTRADRHIQCPKTYGIASPYFSNFTLAFALGTMYIKLSSSSKLSHILKFLTFEHFACYLKGYEFLKNQKNTPSYSLLQYGRSLHTATYELCDLAQLT